MGIHVLQPASKPLQPIASVCQPPVDDQGIARARLEMHPKSMTNDGTAGSTYCAITNPPHPHLTVRHPRKRCPYTQSPSPAVPLGAGENPRRRQTPGASPPRALACALRHGCCWFPRYTTSCAGTASSQVGWSLGGVGWGVHGAVGRVGDDSRRLLAGASYSAAAC